MRKSAVTLLSVVSALVICGCASLESHVDKSFDFSTLKQVAVLKVTGLAGNQVAQYQIADMWEGYLIDKGYAVVDRARVQDVVQEQEFQAGALTEAGAAETGRILNADAILIANVIERGEEMSMTAKLVHTTTARVVWTASGAKSTGKTLGTIGGAVVGATAGAALGGSRSGKLAAGALGAAAGGVAGRALTSLQSELAQKLVKRLGRTLPPH